MRLRSAFEAGHEREARGVLELALAGMHVERDEAHLSPVDAHGERLDRSVPERRFNGREGEAEQLAVEVQDRLPHGAVLEVRAQLAAVVAVLARLDPLEQVLGVPAADRLGALLGDQVAVLRRGALAARRERALDEVAYRPGGPGHLVLSGVLGPVRIAEEGRKLGPLRQHPLAST